jgi:hypothetical protein
MPGSRPAAGRHRGVLGGALFAFGVPLRFAVFFHRSEQG